MSNVTIISDGTAVGTKIKIGDEFMSGVTRVEINPILPGEMIRAKITVDVVALRMQIANADIECTDVLTVEKIRDVLFRFDNKDTV